MACKPPQRRGVRRSLCAQPGPGALAAASVDASTRYAVARLLHTNAERQFRRGRAKLERTFRSSTSWLM
jgi:hypothetical protein